MGKRRRKSLLQRTRPPDQDPTPDPTEPADELALEVDAAGADSEEPASEEPVSEEPASEEPASEEPEADASVTDLTPEEPTPAQVEQDAPPIPLGWPLEANLSPPNLPGTRGDTPRPPVPAPPPAPPRPTPAKPPHTEPVFAAQRAMLKGHSRPPTVEPLVSSQEWRMMAIALTISLSLIALGVGGFLGLFSVIWGFVG